MKWTLLAPALAPLSCQHGDGSSPAKGAPPDKPRAQVSEGYRADLDNLCNAVQRSGADKVDDDQRIALIAMWLGPNIKTPEGHDFLVSIQPLAGEAKAKALDDEAHRVGLAGCALSAEWRK
jgi:hypothetical protein